MNYSVNHVTTIPECEVLLDSAQEERGDLSFRKTQQERLYKSVTDGSGSVEAELVMVLSEITGLETKMAMLPDGPTKKQFEDRLVTLRYKKFQLEKRNERFGIAAMLETEYAISCIEKDLAETDVYIAALTARKAEL